MSTEPINHDDDLGDDGIVEELDQLQRMVALRRAQRVADDPEAIEWDDIAEQVGGDLVRAWGRLHPPRKKSETG